MRAGLGFVAERRAPGRPSPRTMGSTGPQARSSPWWRFRPRICWAGSASARPVVRKLQASLKWSFPSPLPPFTLGTISGSRVTRGGHGMILDHGWGWQGGLLRAAPPAWLGQQCEGEGRNGGGPLLSEPEAPTRQPSSQGQRPATASGPRSGTGHRPALRLGSGVGQNCYWSNLRQPDKISRSFTSSHPKKWQRPRS